VDTVTKHGGGGQSGKTAFQQKGRPQPFCRYCKQDGHAIEACPKLKDKRVNFGPPPPQTNCVELCTFSPESPIPSWLIDSGSTDHISPDCENMVDYVKYDEPEFLIVANGGREKILGEGTVQIKLETGNTFFLYNVKHVPASKKYLMSVGKAYQDGIDVHIRGIQCYLTDSNGELVGHARHVFPYQWLTDLSLQDYPNALAIMELRKWKLYTGKASKEELDEWGEEPFGLNIMKTMVDKFVDSDPTLLKIKTDLNIAETKVKMVEDFLKVLSNRNFAIKSAIDWNKLVNGIS
jgi:hypothetical protein